ncbi:putative NCS1 family nucleobase:cation symporter-1 [Rosellinia necatrix]|uniref:Putative NCS1 family nucleobase:cation symporter-1 n=1 Tax=Rosellinia necatrix TaxID=77044 RepID=A0A1W2TR90_ROSNE|nr:putative NCS1 family nucleobase:cation symporter-1 [Rosellinia necatrix]
MNEPLAGERTLQNAGVPVDADDTESQSKLSTLSPLLAKLSSWGVELRGITPVPLEERADRRFINVFFVWFAMNTNISPIITGMLGTFVFGISLRDCSLVILFFGLLSALPAAYFSTFGPRTGLRQMLHARYTFGYYLTPVIAVLNLATISGFGIISCILGGSTLAAVSDGQLDSTVGIVVITLVGLVVSFGGYRFIHQFERYAWIFALIAIVITTGVGGKALVNQAETPLPSPTLIVSFSGVVGGFLISWTPLASDFSVYCDPSVSSFRIFAYTYAGLVLPTVSLMVLGAAIGGATADNPAWAEGYARYTVGGVLEAMLRPAGGFGKFIAVVLSLSVLGNLSASMYSISLSLQLLLPFFARIPRFVFSLVYGAIAIPVAIRAARSFFDSLQNFIYLIAYWSAAYVGVIGVEHFIFRNADPTSYIPEHWNQPSKLPTGISAILAASLSFALVVPSTSQAWYTGPIAATTGDIGFEVALTLSSILYVPIRWLELKWRPI